MSRRSVSHIAEYQFSPDGPRNISDVPCHVQINESMTFQSEEKQKNIYNALNKINNNRHLKSVKSTVEIISQLIANIKQ